MADDPAPTDPRDADGPADDVVELAHRLLDLARSGDVALLAYIDAGVPVGLTGPDGDTLLMLAAYHGHAGLVTGLVERGADPDAANDRGQTPLAGAVFKGEPDVIDALRDAGADPDLGTPTARETARVFERPDLEARLDGEA